MPSAVADYVQLLGVSKQYGALKANDDISLAVKPGEIHVIVGENGAGKSTLMGILSGTVVPDSGSVLIGGKDVTGFDARAAIDQGVGMVHQHFRLVGAFTVAENIALGSEPTRRFGWLDRAQARRSAREVSTAFGLSVDPDAIVNDMSVGMQQRVEIVKTLTRDARVLIFDEPTAVLTEEEAEGLFAILRRLREDGRAILFITHKLREALSLGDTISVLRRGRLVRTMKPSETTVSELGTLMVGREVRGARRTATTKLAPDAPVLIEARGVSMASRTLHGVALRDLDLSVRAGEVRGILGVDGNGQQEIVSMLTGLSAPDAGNVLINSRDMTGLPNAAFLQAGLGVIPGDRHLEGLVLSMSIARNLILDRRDDKRFLSGGMFIRERALNDYAREMITKYDIRAQGPRQAVGRLSGGNQQKVVIARELERDISVLIAANPTRGLDIGSIEFVHNQLLALADRGNAVIVVTADLDEAMAVSSSISVLYHGSLVGTVTPPYDRHEIGILMGGK